MDISLVIFASVLLIWAVAALGLFASMDNQVEALASTYEIPLDDRIRERLAGSILWTRRWRVAGGIVATVVAAAARLDLTLLVIAAGVAVGSILAEVFRPNGTSNHIRVASLERRRLTDYVNGWVLNALAGLVVGSVASVGLYLRSSPNPTPRRSASPVQPC